MSITEEKRVNYYYKIFINKVMANIISNNNLHAHIIIQNSKSQLKKFMIFKKGDTYIISFKGYYKEMLKFLKYVNNFFTNYNIEVDARRESNSEVGWINFNYTLKSPKEDLNYAYLCEQEKVNNLEVTERVR